MQIEHYSNCWLLPCCLHRKHKSRNRVQRRFRLDNHDQHLYYCQKHALSESHLHKLFRSTFNQPLGFYIRTYKLAESIDDLLNTKLKILDIALGYGFEYEQSYIRAFKREFGITPCELRRSVYCDKTHQSLHNLDNEDDKNTTSVSLSYS
ncbi:MAG: helix-turn-helix transcriptional regulator [Treponema sp.]|jgi:AraC-like DNA-binding protein|nr:helix-turn-helix transcriptional regulator [Treponema sp.]